MKIGLVVDGEAEFHSLPHLLRKIETDHKVLHAPLKVPISGCAPPGQIANHLGSRFRILRAKGVEHACVLLDREQLELCPAGLARTIWSATRDVAAAIGLQGVTVVIKDRMYENWLLSDIEAVTSLGGRFQLSEGVVRAVQADRADSVDALGVLKRAAQRASYEKVTDAIRIMRVADPARIAANSRSFRRFLRVVGDQTFRSQSKRRPNEV